MAHRLVQSVNAQLARGRQRRDEGSSHPVVGITGGDDGVDGDNVLSQRRGDIMRALWTTSGEAPTLVVFLRGFVQKFRPLDADKQNRPVVEYTRCRVKTKSKLTNLKINSRT